MAIKMILNAIKAKYKSWSDHWFLKRHGCDSWKQYYHMYDPDVNYRANEVKLYYDGYPYVYQFDRRSGRRIRAFKLPDMFAATSLSAMGDTEIAGNTVGRIANKGMEGLAITPDGRYLVGAMQSPLAQEKLRLKIQAIFKHQTQKDSAPFPGSDEREFWQRVETRNKETAATLDRLGLAEYFAMEAYVVA